MNSKLFLALVCLLMAYTSWSNPITVHLEDFNTCATVSWTNIAASGDNDSFDEWSCNSTDGTYIANGFSGGNDDDWLVSPSINMDTYTGEYFIFEYLNDFSGADIELYYSLDFSGNYTTADMEAATWNSIILELYDIDGDSYISNFLPYSAIDISSIAGANVYFAFRYTATGNSGGSEIWELDNIRILADYYGSVPNNLDCAALKTKLYNLIDDHYVITYTSADFDVWDSQYVTDRRENDAATEIIVKDRYSENPGGAEPYEYTHGADRDPGGSGFPEGVYYNREHVFSVSWWGGGTVSHVDTQFTDIHMIIPADKFVNQERSNFPMGEVASASQTFLNGSLLGTSSSTGYANTVFEPIDEFKGDIARIFFYMAVRYEHLIAGWETLNSRGDDVMNGDSYTVYEDWFRDQLILWHNNDPVSSVEIDRNNAIYSIQGNRNPFVDNPAYVNDIWGPVCMALPVELSAFHVNKNREGVQLSWQTNSELNNDYFEVEHSLDGHNFETLGYVDGFGDSGQSQSYHFLHPQPASGFNYYRLRQFDFNGTSTLSEMRSVNIEEEKNLLLYPNPADQVLNLKIADTGQAIHIIIRDYLGRSQKEISISGGVELVKLNLVGMAQGGYLLEVWSDQHRLDVQRFIKR